MNVLLCMCLQAAATLSGGGSPADAGAPGTVRNEGAGHLEWCDYDGDGLRDVYVVGSVGEDRLLRNRGDGSFEDVTRAAGLAGSSRTRQAAWCDADRDGRTDLLVVRDGRAPSLLRNTQDAGFQDVTFVAGLSTAPLRAARWLDFDRDGWPDLETTEERGDALYHNRGDGRFGRVSLFGPELPAGSVGGSGGGILGMTGGARRHGGPTTTAVAMATCVDSLEDQAAPGTCLQASTLPGLGLLYPLSQDLFVDATGNVGMGTTTPGAKLTVDGPFIRRIARATGLGPGESLSVGPSPVPLASRTLTFTKTQADTAIRVSYTDNFRVFNSSSFAAGRWELRVDGAAPPGGAVVFDFYTGGLPLLHRSGTLVGYCEGLGAGVYTLQVHVQAVPGYSSVSTFTGWNDSRWTLEAEEVY